MSARENAWREAAQRPVSGQKKVWDIVVRTGHWSLAAAIAYEFLAEAGTNTHVILGYCVAVVVGLRVLWGGVGTHHARFSNFMVGPLRAVRYVSDILLGHPERFLGHNPAGAVMIAALLFVVTCTSISGILMTSERFWGNQLVESLHSAFSNVLLVLILGHIVGVVVASIQHRENLVLSMLTGWKKAEINGEEHEH